MRGAGASPAARFSACRETTKRALPYSAGMKQPLPFWRFQPAVNPFQPVVNLLLTLLNPFCHVLTMNVQWGCSEGAVRAQCDLEHRHVGYVYKNSVFDTYHVPKGGPFETPMNAKKEAEAGSRLAERPRRGLALTRVERPTLRQGQEEAARPLSALAKLARLNAPKLADSGGLHLVFILKGYLWRVKMAGKRARMRVSS